MSNNGCILAGYGVVIAVYGVAAFVVIHVVIHFIQKVW